MRKKLKIDGVVVVSDLHCGSSVALWPDKHKSSTGNTIGLGDNLHQQWLWSCWQDAIAKVKAHFKGRNFAVICNGDLIEGIHHGTTEVVVAKNADHASAAIECLAPLISGATESYFVAGTECHVGDWEQKICADLRGKWCGDKGLIEINGTLIDVSHHCPTSSRAYLEAGGMSISMGNARLNYARVGHRLPKVFLRAHRHTGGYYSDGNAAYVITPAWQLLTRYGFKVVTDSICRPGFVILDWQSTTPGGIPSILLNTYEPKETRPFIV